MKTKIGLFLLLVTLLLWGCDKGSLIVVPPIPPEPQPKTYTATLIFKVAGEEKTETITGIKAGETKSFKIVEYPGYSCIAVVVNDVPQSLPISDVSLTITSDVKIRADYVSTNFIIISAGADKKEDPWYVKNRSFYNENNLFLDSLLLTQTPEVLVEKFFFYSTKRYEIISSSGVHSGGGTWNFDVQYFYYDHKKCRIVIIDLKNFVIDLPSFVDSNGTVTHQRITFVRK